MRTLLLPKRTSAPGWTLMLLTALACACAGRGDALQEDGSVLSIPARAEQLPGPAADASESLFGVRVDIAVDAWDGPRGILLDDVVPVRVTIDNGGPTTLRIAPRNFNLVSTTSDRAFAAVPPKRLLAAGDDATHETVDILMRSLPDGELQPGAKTSGFVFFELPDDDELGVRLQVPLVSAADGERLGLIEMPIEVEQPR